MLRLLVLASVLVALSAGQALFPPRVTNATTLRPIGASATCGSPPRTNCDVFQTKDCFACDSTCPAITGPIVSGLQTIAQPECECDVVGCQRLNTNAHPAQFANDLSATTFWQSPDNLEIVNITVDMLWEQEVQEITVFFETPVPKAMVILRSADGQAYWPYQYFAQDCQATFQMSASAPTSAEQPACSPTDIQASSLYFNTLAQRPGAASYPTDEDLQRFTRARFLRFMMVNFFKKEDASDPFDPSTTLPHHNFYMMKDIRVAARCSCNGHGTQCIVFPNEQYGCICEHNTETLNCSRCKPLFNSKPYRRGTSPDVVSTCKECKCYNHASSCHYNASFDSNPDSQVDGDGGVCDNCRDNTAGQHCETCQAFYYETPNVLREAANACSSCACTMAGVEDDGVCHMKTGQCKCKARVSGRTCNACDAEFYNLQASNPQGCQECQCALLATINGSNVCDQGTGQCPCIPSNTGRDCSRCLDGWFQPPQSLTGVCQACHPQCSAAGCHAFGFTTTECKGCRHVQENGVCVSNCSSSHFPDHYDICQPCHPQCAGGCSGPKPTTTDCVRCINFEHLGQCVTVCPNNTYPDVNNVCQPCDTQCIGGCTGPQPSQCLQCRAAKDLTNCVAACPTHKYEDGNGLCQPCNSLCNASVGCIGPRADQCLACAAVVAFDDEEQRPFCANQCPKLSVSLIETYNGQEGARVCRPCNPECADACSGLTDAECVGSCRHFSYNGRCVAGCPAHTFIKNATLCARCNEACDAATGCAGPASNECFQCDAETAFSFAVHHCVSLCPLGHYDDSERVCQPCDAQCYECSGPGNRQCSQCRNAVFGGACVATCPLDISFPSAQPPDQPGGEDEQLTAEPGMEMPEGTSYCVHCDSECAPEGCTGPSNAQCKACKNVGYKDVCLRECPTLTFRSAAICLDCHPQCQNGCSGPTDTACDECRNFLDNATACVETCPAHRYVQGQNCLTCHPQCSENIPGCRGPQASQCTACATVNDTLTGNCVASCPLGTYRDGGLCLPCNSECYEGCSGPQPNQCQQCRTYVDDGTCVSACPLLKYPHESGQCIGCNEECSDDCEGPRADQCVVLDSQTGCVNARQGTTCVASCDTDYFFDEMYCRKCASQCDAQGCTGATARDCRQCLSVNLAGTCLAACPNSHYADSNKQCQACDAQCTSLNANASSFNSPFCSGPEPTQCTSCMAYKRGSACVASCNATAEYVQGTTCVACHAQCSGGCSGPLSTQCHACAAWKLGDTCVAACPLDSTFANPATRVCESCAAECNTTPLLAGCPAGTSANGCRQCLGVRMDNQCQTGCSVTHYPDQTDVSMALGGVCAPCHSQCDPARGCLGPLATDCNQCQRFNYQGTCLSACPALSFSNNGICNDCNANCLLGCTGSGAGACARLAGQFLTHNATTYGCRVVAQVHVDTGDAVCMSSCPLRTYPDANSLCQPCHPSCDKVLGCIGPADHQCVACPATQFLDRMKSECTNCHVQCQEGCGDASAEGCFVCKGVRKDGTCISDCSAFVSTHFTDLSNVAEKRCVPCDLQCDGCSGLGPEKCLKCKNYATPAGRCVSNCNHGYVTSLSGVQTCNPCDPQCSGTCKGPLASQCDVCASVRLRNGICASACPVNEVKGTDGRCSCPTATATLMDDVCVACDMQCATGCTGPSDSQCLPGGCRNVQLRSGTCASTCPAHEVPINKLCTCPANAVLLNNICSLCHQQCGESGCTGTSSSQCKAMPEGCRNFFSKDACVEQCPLNEQRESPSSRICTCRPLHFRDRSTDQCLPCHAECIEGCTGTGPTQCTSCKNYKSGSTCVSTCADNEAPNAERICTECHPQCINGCRGPSDKFLCGVTAAESNKCKNVLSMDGACEAQCPAGQAEYENTKVCVLSDDSNNTETIMLVVAIILGVFALAAFIGIVIVRRQRQRVRQMPLSSPKSTTRPNARASTKGDLTNMGGGNASRSSMVFDPNYDQDFNFDNEGTPGSRHGTSYLDKSYTDDVDMDHYLDVSFQQPQLYNLAEGDQAYDMASHEVESTHI